MLARASCRTVQLSRCNLSGSRQNYATMPTIPVLPPNQPRKKASREGDAVPPMLPPDVSAEIPLNSQPTPVSGSASDPAPKPVVFGTEPVLLDDTPAPLKKTHRLRNTFLASVLGGALLFGGGAYASLENDTAYELFTEFVPYGEDVVLYLQEREFRMRFPQAQSHISKAAARSTSPSVYIPQSGAVAKIRQDTDKHTDATILQRGPQNSAVLDKDKATAGGANDAQALNKMTAGNQAGSGETAGPGLDKTGKLPEPATKTGPGLDKTGKLPEPATPAPAPRHSIPVSVSEPAPQVAKKAAVKAPEPEPVVLQQPSVAPKNLAAVEPVPLPSPAIKTFDIPKANDKSIERLQFALNGIIKAANEYGSSSFFKASLENAKDEVLALNKQIAEVQAQEQLKADKRLSEQAQEYGKMQQHQIAEVNAQIADYERRMSIELERERHRLNQAYIERLAEEVKRVESLSEQKLRNELMEQAIEMQRKLNREIKSRVEEERGGRLGKLEALEKSIAELKQLNVDSATFINERSKLQDLEVALNGLKVVLHEPVPRAFSKELTAIKEIAGTDELLLATIESIDKESYEAGVPTVGQLADRFRSVAEEVRKASLLPENAGVAGHATSWLLSKVLFRKRGMVPGSDIEAVLARTEAYLEANDLDSATREMNSLTGWAHIISGDWLKMARRSLELQQAVELMENSVVLQALKSQS